MKDRFKKLRNYLALTQAEMAEKLSKKKRIIAYYESGERNIDDGVLFRLQEAFNVNPAWLRGGTGEMFNNVTIGDLKTKLSTPKARRPVCVRYFPEVSAAAGAGAFVADETTEDYVLDSFAVKSPKYDVVINVVGDSMLPTLQDKDLILVDTNVLGLKRLIKNQIYVIRTTDLIIIKRYIGRKGSLCTFKSDNPEFGNINIDFADEHNKIVGIPRNLIYRQLQEIDEEEEGAS